MRPIRDILAHARLRQIRGTAKLVSFLNRMSPVASMIRSSRSWPLPRRLFDALAGYRRAFETLAEANTAAARYLAVGHDCDDNIRMLLAQTESARPSDYPVLFHMDRMVHRSATLFDLGGNVGNLFYCYAKYLGFGPEFRWTVLDLPATIATGRRIAEDRRERRLVFTSDCRDADGVDVFLASGSLHYFEASVADMLHSLVNKPRHVIINRTPLTDGVPTATVQDVGTFLLGCKTIARAGLFDSMCELGYEEVDSWRVPELSVEIPFYPELSVPAYSGAYFHLKHG